MTLVVLALMTCAGCAGSKIPVFSPLDECRALLAHGEKPAISPGDDARAQIARHRVAITGRDKAMDRASACLTRHRG